MESGNSELTSVLQAAVDLGASDLTLKPGSPAAAKVQGRERKIQLGCFSQEQLQSGLRALLSDQGPKLLEDSGQLVEACGYRGQQPGSPQIRFRLTVCRTREGLSAHLRWHHPETLRGDLRLPEAVDSLLYGPPSLVLVCGGYESGLTTTVAALVDELNRNQRLHILTLDDPIEILHPHKTAMLTQRDIREDTAGWEAALQEAIELHPQVVALSEVQSSLALARAVELVESGVLVVAGFRARDTLSAVQRAISLLEERTHPSLKQRFCQILGGMLARRLVLTEDRLVPVSEILLATPAIKTLLVEERWRQIYNAVQTGSRLGMFTFEQDLYHAVGLGLLTSEEALQATLYPEELRRALDTVR